MEYLRPWNPEVLHVRGEQINIPVLIASVFGHGRGSESYVDCFIGRVRPRLVVTFIDNNLAFYSIASRHKNVRTLFVQNGTRGHYLDIFEILGRTGLPRSPLKVDYMMTFGKRIGLEYAKHIQGAVVPMGSLVNNTVPRRHSPRSGVIGFVSQYRTTEGFTMAGRFFSRQVFFERADECVLRFLRKYAVDHGKRLSVITYCDVCGDEKELMQEKRYYQDMLGGACDFLKSGDLYATSYDSADSVEVVVTIDSTLGYECASRGNKTAIFSIRSKILDLSGFTYGWPETYPDEGPFWTNLPDAEVFGRILDHLFAIDAEQWRAELADNGFTDVMAYDPGNGILQRILTKELGNPPQPHSVTTRSDS